MDFRYSIPSPRQRSTRLDHRWDRVPGEWKHLIDYKSSLEAWGCVGSDLLVSTPCLDNDINAFTSERYHSHDLS